MEAPAVEHGTNNTKIMCSIPMHELKIKYSMQHKLLWTESIYKCITAGKKYIFPNMFENMLPLVCKKNCSDADLHIWQGVKLFLSLILTYLSVEQQCVFLCMYILVRCQFQSWCL